MKFNGKAHDDAVIIAIQPYPDDRPSLLLTVGVNIIVMLLIWALATWMMPAAPDCPAMVTPVMTEVGR